MDQVTSVVAALDAGKLPSQQQVTHIVDWFQHSVLAQAQPSGTGNELSAQGKAIADDVGQILEAYKILGEHKNGDNLLQKALWHLAQGDISETSIDVPRVDIDEATADIRKLRSALRTLLQVLWTNVSSEGTSLLQDFASFFRLALADAAEAVETQAHKAKEGLRDVESGVQEGERDSLGRLKKSKEEEERDRDPKVRWEKGMERVKDTGSTVIGAGQSAAETAEDAKERVGGRVTDAYYQVCERAQKDPQYHAAISTLFDTVHKWVTKSLDTAEAKSPTSRSFITDPNPEQHIPKALECLRKLAERFAGGRSLGSLFEKAKTCAVDVRQDKDLNKWFQDFFAHVKKSLDEPGYARSDQARGGYDGLRTRWKELEDQDSKIGKKWKQDVFALKTEINAFDRAMQSDADMKRVKAAHENFGRHIEDGFVHAEKKGMQMAMDQVSWFWQDLFKVYTPRILGMLRDIPIPRTEYKDQEVEFVLENVDVSSFNLLPSHIYIRNITDIDINTPASTSEESKTAMGTLTHIRIQAMQLTLKDVSFFYNDKSMTLGPSKFTGVMEFKLPEKGVDIDLKFRLIPTTPEGLKSRERHGGFHQIDKVDVKVAEEVDLQIKKCNHAIMLSLFKPIVGLRLRATLEKALQEQIRASLEWVDGVAWDVSKRAEVFSDAGLSTGSSYVAAFWSEIGRLERMKGGFFSGWRATGSGLMKEGEDRGPQFAMGVEPQIISGTKHGPAAAFAEPLADRLRSGTDSETLDTDAGLVKDVAANTVNEGKEVVKTFQQTVEEKAALEKAKSGWESVAFDIDARA